MARRESILKSKLTKVLSEFFIVQRHEDFRTSGIPDISLTRGGWTSWVEVKHGAPRFDIHGRQHRQLCLLDHFGYARYVVFGEDAEGANTYTEIVKPCRDFGDVEARYIGHNYEGVTKFFLAIHQSGREARNR